MTSPNGMSTPSDPEFQVAVIAAFKPGEQKKLKEIANKGVHGTGYIEGTVFQRGKPTDGCWVCSIMDRLATRIELLLSGSVSQYFDNLPIATSAIVRIRTDGLSLEDRPAEGNRLTLSKRFAWRGGVVLYVKNPKTGAEVFLNTLQVPSDDPHTSIPPPITCADEHENAEISTVPKKRKRSPLTTSRATQGTLPVESQECINVDGPDPGEQVLPSTGANATAAADQTAETGNDSHNPQSLPSPPPEMTESKEVVFGHASMDGPGPETNHVSGVNSTGCHAAPPAPLAQSADARSASLIHPGATGAPIAKKKERANLERNQNRRGKKRQRLVAARAEEGVKALSRNGSVEIDPDDALWADAEREIPDDMLPQDAVQQHVVEVSHNFVVRHPSRSQTPVEKERRSAPASHTNVNENSDTVAFLRNGCQTSFGAYTPLIAFEGTGTRCIMGVVNAPSCGTKTKTSEYMAKFVLYDPSNYAASGLSVILFEKTEEALPSPDVGDVLLLRNISCDNFNGHSAVGPSFKTWQWAVFHVKTGKLSSAVPNTMRYLKPEKTELHYSLRLGDWWRDTASSAVSAGFELAEITSTRRVRPHKLISDVRDGEFFDCTVEVLHGFQNDNSIHNIYTLFVTDFTRNPNVHAKHGTWCPPQLVPYVFPVELWDRATAVGPTMKPGEFYSIRNMKAKWSGENSLEGRMQEGEKIVKLDEDELENQPRLVDLLKRKREWEAQSNVVDGVVEFPHRLIGEVDEYQHFNCTVEVVHVSSKDEYLFLYVTDYTTRSDLVPVAPSITSDLLVDRVVRVYLYDQQVEIAKNLEPGDFVAIRNLRLKPSGSDRRLCGRLGGDQRLITKLNPRAASNAELKALLRRKAELEEAHAQPKPKKRARAARQARSSEETESTVSARVKGKGKGKAVVKDGHLVSLAEVKASDACPTVFRVRARVVDFYPDDLGECTVLRCTSCKEDIPRTRQRCAKCDDAMEDETFVRAFFQLFFRIADEEGTTLDVSVSDERCSVLHDLIPDDVYEDDEAFAMLVSRVKPLLGDLLNLSSGEARRRPIDQDDEEACTPLLELTLGSWLPDGEPDAAESRAYIVMKHTLCDA